MGAMGKCNHLPVVSRVSVIPTGKRVRLPMAPNSVAKPFREQTNTIGKKSGRGRGGGGGWGRGPQPSRHDGRGHSSRGHSRAPDHRSWKAPPRARGPPGPRPPAPAPAAAQPAYRREGRRGGGASQRRAGRFERRGAISRVTRTAGSRPAAAPLVALTRCLLAALGRPSRTFAARGAGAAVPRSACWQGHGKQGRARGQVAAAKVSQEQSRPRTQCWYMIFQSRSRLTAEWQAPSGLPVATQGFRDPCYATSSL